MSKERIYLDFKKWIKGPNNQELSVHTSVANDTYGPLTIVITNWSVCNQEFFQRISDFSEDIKYSLNSGGDQIKVIINPRETSDYDDDNDDDYDTEAKLSTMEPLATVIVMMGLVITATTCTEWESWSFLF